MPTLAAKLPGRNPSLAGLLVDHGHLQGVYTHSFATTELDWNHVEIEPPAESTVEAFRMWFSQHDAAMKAALDRLSDEELHTDWIDRGDGFIASPFVQHQIYREAVYIFYGARRASICGLSRSTPVRAGLPGSADRARLAREPSAASTRSFDQTDASA